MTDYTEHSDALFEAEKPILGITHLEARDNLIATAEGSPGAPKVAPLALRSPFMLSGEGVQTGLGNHASAVLWASLFFRFTGATSGTSTIRYRLSTDNGVSWEPWITLVTIGATEPFTGFDATEIKISLAGYNAIQMDYDGPATGGDFSIGYGMSAKFYGGA